MSLTNSQLKKFQTIYKNHFGVELSCAEAYEKSESLVRMVELTYKPMTEKELAMVEKRRKELLNN